MAPVVVLNQNILEQKISELNLNQVKESCAEIINVTNNKNLNVVESESNKVQNTHPKHVGIIPDGNRRWARANGIPVNKAHEAACEKLIPLLDDLFAKTKTEIVTVWGLSTENLERPRGEVDALFNVVRKFVPEFLPTAHKYGCSIHRIGNMAKIPRDVLKLMDQAAEETAHYTSRQCNIAINYGGKWDIVTAVNEFIRENPGQEITEQDVNHYISLSKDNLPEPDLIVRTGADSQCKRTSGFLPWQSTYTEFYFIEKLLPEVTFKDFDEAIQAFGNTKRRFGK